MGRLKVVEWRVYLREGVRDIVFGRQISLKIIVEVPADVRP